MVVSEKMPAAPAIVTNPSGQTTLKGKVSLPAGLIVERPMIAVRGNPECAVFHPDGKIPSESLVVNANGGVENTFIYVKEGLENYKSEAPTEPVQIDNRGCMYVPHVAGVQVGQPVNFTNSDPTLHNVHATAQNNKSFNIGLPFSGMKQTKTYEKPEIMVHLKCDVHPWMNGYLGVLDHPFFSVTDADGNFEIKNLPPGKYTVEAWHEQLGVQSQTIEIKPQEAKELNFTLKAEATPKTKS